MNMVLVLSCAFGPISMSYADFWASPKVQTYQSSNGKYVLTVKPGEVGLGKIDPSVYFEDLMDEKEKSLVSKPESIDCTGKLEYKESAESDLELIWEAELSNRTAPGSAIVSNDGFVATFDNWHSMGHGTNAVVIYAQNGELVREYSLTDFLSDERYEGLTRTISSIWWGSRHVFENGNLVLRVIRSEKDLQIEKGRYEI